MSNKNRLIDSIAERLENLSIQTARPEALIQLSFLGLLTGLLTGLVAVGFLLAIELPLSYLLPLNESENFEALSTEMRLLAPLIGSCLLVLLFHYYAHRNYSVGIVHVIERLHYHQGYLKLREFILQFLGGAIALMSGHSMGREGPSVHLGAAIGSQLGQQLRLPNNAIRTLLACGSAAAIAASFNTPLAGVIFAMEVIMLEYTVLSFVPVMVAAVSATAVFRLLVGNEPIFLIESLPVVPLEQIPLVVTLGLVIGSISALFSIMTHYLTQWTRDWSMPVRFLLAGLATGLIAITVPQVMGVGYDTVNQSILGEISVSLLCLILAAKLLSTSIAVGCGIPAGLIGPTVFLGAIVGSLVGLTLHTYNDSFASASATYALIGMSAMLGATLQAPLTALITVFELTANPHIIWPSMIAIVISQLVSKQLFRQPPVFEMLLRMRGLDYRYDSVAQSLRTLGVRAALETDFRLVSRHLQAQAIQQLSTTLPKWIVIEEENTIGSILPGIDLRNYLTSQDALQEIDLMNIPAKRLQSMPIDIRSTLADADRLFKREGAEALYVCSTDRKGTKRLVGIITRERFYTAFSN